MEIIEKIKTFGDFLEETETQKQEIKAFERIKRALNDIPAIFYFKPVLTSLYSEKEPDAIWFNPNIGIAIIEIKLWDKEYLRDKKFNSKGKLVIKKSFFEKLIGTLKEEVANRNPYRQVRDYENTVMEIIKNTLDKGIPIKGFVYFPNLSKIDIEFLDGTIRNEIKNNIHKTFFKDSKKDEIKDKIFSQLGTRNLFKELSEEDFNIIRSKLFPLATVPKKDLDKFSFENIKILDLFQEGLLYKIKPVKIESGKPYKDKIIRGTAGTGKTVVLLSKAIYEKQKNKKAKIIILSYTNSLVNEMKESLLSTIKARNLPEDLEKIEFSTVDSLINKIAEKLEIKNEDKDEDEKSDSTAEKVLDVLEKGENVLPEDFKYDVVLVDETQDLTYTKIKILHYIKKDKYIAIWGIDETQRIYSIEEDGPPEFKWIKGNIDAKGNTIVLKKSYRNPSNVFNFARNFLRLDKKLSDDLRELKLENVEIKREDNNSSNIEFLETKDKSLSYVINGKVIDLIKKGYKPEDILILLPYGKDVEIIGQFLKTFLDKFKMKDLVHWFYADTHKDDKGTMPKKINITTYHSSKGLERPVVILGRINALPLYRYQLEKNGKKQRRKPFVSEVRLDRRLLFVAMTRANKELILIYDNQFTNYNDEYYRNFGDEIKELLDKKIIR